MIDKILRIREIIVKKQLDVLTENEKAELDQWVSESDENVSLYHSIISAQNIEERFALYDCIDLEKSKKILHQRISPKQTSREIWCKVGRWAAVFVLPLAVAYFLYNNQQSNKYQRLVQRNMVQHAKAVLILDDGKTIDLEKSQGTKLEIYKEVKTQNENSQLIYSTPEENPNTDDVAEILNTLKTSSTLNGGYQLGLSDGTKVWLNNETELKYPICFKGNVRKVYLKGEAYFEVAKDSEHPFIVDVNGRSDVKVLGTKFNVSAYENKAEIMTTLLEGSVQVSHTPVTGNMENLSSAETSLILVPGEQAIMGPDGSFIKRNVNPTLFTSWIQGIYIFNNLELQEIASLIHRWYGLEIFFDNEYMKHIRFTGAINKNKPLDDFVALIEKTSSVRFSILDEALLIKEKE